MTSATFHGTASPASDEAPSATQRPAGWPDDAVDGARDFDFLHGRWRVWNRRLRRPVIVGGGAADAGAAAGAAAWEEFEGTSVVRAVWDGDGNVEEWAADAPAGPLQAVSLHLYDRAARQWRLHWATRAEGRVGPPTVGAFAGPRGEFFACEDVEGRATLLRIVWERVGPTACRFEQALSSDGGRTWTVDWVMQFTRDDSP